MNNPAKYLLYIRQSVTADKDESLSLAFQERSLRELVTRDGGVVLEPPIVDADEKGWDPNRPGITRLMERIEREHPDAIAVYAVSRLARDNWLAEGLWRRAQALRPGLSFRSVTEPHAHDDMVRGILGVISQAERKRMGAFLSSAFRERARQGKPHGRVPFGYTKGADGRLVIDPEAADWVRQIVDRFEAGWSFWRIAVWLTEHEAGGRRWEPNVVRNTLKTPVIAGGVKTADVLVWDCHEPIIGREHHDRLLTLMASRRYTRTKKVSSWLEQLVRCSCGAPMDLCRINHPNGAYANFRCTASPSRAVFQRKRGYAVCASTPRSITRDKAERLTIAALRDAFEHVRGWQEVAADLRRRFDAGAQSHARIRHRLDREHAQATKERERLLVLYKRGSLDVDRWEREDALLAERLAQITVDRDRHPAPPPDADVQARADTLTAIGDHVRLVAATDPAHLRRVLQDTGAVVQLRPGGVRIVWPPDLEGFFPAEHAVV